MESTINIGDRILVDKVLTHPQAGDIVVFTRPAAFDEPTVKYLIKRVIGTPGEYLKTGAGGLIYVDGKILAQPWLSATARAAPGPAICVQTRTDCTGQTLHLPAGQYLVMGDNRSNSDDGRYFGPIPGTSIVGRTFARAQPFTQIHWF